MWNFVQEQETIQKSSSSLSHLEYPKLDCSTRIGALLPILSLCIRKTKTPFSYYLVSVFVQSCERGTEKVNCDNLFTKVKSSATV